MPCFQDFPEKKISSLLALQAKHLLKTKSPPSKQPQKLIKSDNLFPVVGIGASAGGLDAFKKLLSAISEVSGMAYILVQHLDPNHESMLPEILQKVTRIPVLEIADDIKVEPDHIYVLPSNKMMLASDGILKLVPRPTKSKTERHLPIDLFFSSLAEVHQSHAIGVVLSGTASDGTQGLRAIKDHGGITFAQDENSAAFGGMPQSAIQAGVVDFILPPDQIPAKLLEVARVARLATTTEQNLSLDDEESYRQINSVLRIQKGTDFTYYKQTTIRRRILRRMAINKHKVPAVYLAYLKENNEEQDLLYQDLLIQVTDFFRDPNTFENLSANIYPLILENKVPGETLRVWVAGCSTGEEAYSFAISLKEFFARKSSTGKVERVQIFASDLSEIAIEKARLGVYSKMELKSLTPKRLSDFFTKINGSYQVNRQIRDMCVFASHNFLVDPPFGKMDLISCRNVLIYMEPYLQKKALTTFHYALNPTGFLLLGKSETTSGVPDLFASATKNDKLFTRKDVPGRFTQMPSQPGEQYSRQTIVKPKSEPIRSDYQKIADEIILSQFTPAGVIVNEAMDIVQFRGKTSYYLEQTSGKPSHNLLVLAKNGLAFELRSILHRAKKEKAPIKKENIPIEVQGGLLTISIEAIPLPNTIEPYYLILFHRDNPGTILVTQADNKETDSKFRRDNKDLRIWQLEQELAQTREDMRSITEDQEAANEELQSGNEELLSGSEELQSLNEELETSKEELQSTNEELTVINHEMIDLNEQIARARNYAESIVANIREPLLVLDKDLRVKTANRAFYKLFRTNELEIAGVHLYALRTNEWNSAELRTLLEKILPEKSFFNDFEITVPSQSMGELTLLLNAREVVSSSVSEKLILLSIEDVTEKTKLEQKEKEIQSRFQNLLVEAPVAILVLNGPEYVVEIANDAYLKIVEKGKGFIGKPLFDSLPELRNQGIKELLDTVMLSGISYQGNEREIHINRGDKSEKGFYNFVYQPSLDQEGRVTGIIVVVNEVTEQVLAVRRMGGQDLMVRDLFLNAPAFICTLSGPTHVYELVNERYQALFGKRIIQGKPIMEALPELEGQGFDVILDEVYHTGKPFIGIDIPILLARDEGFEPEMSYFNFSYQPMYDEYKNIYSILVFGYEVTEQIVARNKNAVTQQLYRETLESEVKQRTVDLKLSNEKLLDNIEELKSINKELEAFTYVSSHDLQEPLRKIQTFGGLLLEKEKDALSQNGKTYIHFMQDAAKRMQALIDDLLTFSQATTSERKFEIIDLKVLVDKVKNDLREIIAEKQATVEMTESCPAPIIVFQFKQLLSNLIGNALKFSSSQRPPHIKIASKIVEGKEVTTVPLSPDKTYCHLSVSDNGIGFEARFSEKIFELFQKLHNRTEYAGTGIGLAIVKKIVDNHNGRITATSEVNKGTTFDIYIPLIEKNLPNSPA